MPSFYRRGIHTSTGGREPWRGLSACARRRTGLRCWRGPRRSPKRTAPPWWATSGRALLARDVRGRVQRGGTRGARHRNRQAQPAALVRRRIPAEGAVPVVLLRREARETREARRAAKAEAQGTARWGTVNPENPGPMSVLPVVAAGEEPESDEGDRRHEHERPERGGEQQREKDPERPVRSAPSSETSSAEAPPESRHPYSGGVRPAARRPGRDSPAEGIRSRCRPRPRDLDPNPDF